MTPPEQAVIFCGGLGTRLRPLTNDLPKPMAPVLGRPFLDHLIEQLAESGIKRVLLLSGYRADQIARHYASGRHAGVAIRCQATPAEWETGQRLAAAQPLLDERYLLLYGDNYSPLRYASLWSRHLAGQRPLTLTVAPKVTGNIRLHDDGTATYDSSRTQGGATHVELGYMIVERDAIAALEPAQGSFSRVLSQLSDQGRLAAFDTECAYESISDLARLHQLETHLRPRRLLLVDRDGVLNRKAPRGCYVQHRDEFVWIDENVAGLAALAQAGFEFLIVSNQAGVGRGLFTLDAVDTLHAWMLAELARQGIVVRGVYVCPHHWEDHCSCRKPRAGLFFQAQREHRFRLDRTLYLGDDVRDVTAARNAGCGSILVGDEHPEPDAPPDLTVPDILAAVPWIVARFEHWEQSFATPSAAN
ncbi:MAG: HAD-IIIA family hydrolase [Planctomycetaceae bacterium]|nr:HAD-IIIA family hydrolase [Planctomycetaceae bacterium]